MGQVRHAFASAKDDGSDASLVRPSNWNADHVGLALVRKAANQLVTSSTLVNDTHLFFAMAANEVWAFELFLVAMGVDSVDIKYAFDIPAGATIIWSSIGLPATAPDLLNPGLGTVIEADQGASEMGLIGPGIKVLNRIYGTVVNGANAGNLQFMFAQRVTDAGNAVTLYANSWLKGTRAA